MADLHRGTDMRTFSESRGPVALVDLTAKRMTSRAGFMPLYREGFAILEDAAAYMGEHSRADVPQLSRRDKIRYTLESCKLTTTAIRLAAWMMMQRAVVEGEISAHDLAADPNRPMIDAVDLPDWDRVPEGLQGIVARLERFTVRVQRMDSAFYGRLAA